ncbi:hypothetical protein PanWU01x14_229260 [Parasponia andersonii]|uniref:Uncharacterized protein n=1 Tax=Parasponia andersonii TaxID=3476 RepID=A0A2P5BLH4_PARAD|nr:hypothetical protein PanWU01x14_229260 [Parasponia andersonii]
MTHHKPNRQMRIFPIEEGFSLRYF